MSPELDSIRSQDAETRFKYLLNEVTNHGEIWILTDEHGCVMLNTDDEDCVPVWPNRDFAQAWATAEWSECEPKSISLKTWQERWTRGLEGDDVSVVVFPNPEEDGLVLFPDEFDVELSKQLKKRSRP